MCGLDAALTVECWDISMWLIELDADGMRVDMFEILNARLL